MSQFPLAERHEFTATGVDVKDEHDVVFEVHEETTTGKDVFRDPSHTPGGPTPSGTAAALDGTGAAGSSATYSRGDHKHADANRPTDDQKAALAGTQGTPSALNLYVTDGDLRNTDARTPTAHTHPESEIVGLVSDLSALALSIAAVDAAAEHVANKNAAGGYAGLSAGSKIAGAQQTYGSASNTACEGNDARLSDARTPSAHKTSHQDGGSDELSVTGLSGLLADTQHPIIGSLVTEAVAGNDARLTDARTPTAHKTSHQDGGSDELSVTGLSGLLADTQHPIIGSLATEAVAGNDARLTDARTPTAHASTHAAVGSDPLTLSESQITNLTTDLAAKVPSTRSVISGGGLTGGGDLSADRTLAVGAGTGITVNADDVAVNYGTTGVTACVGNDSRLSNSRTPTAHAASHASAGSDALTLAESQITNLTTDLAAKEATANKDAASGYAGLSAASKLAGAQQAYGSAANTACEGNDARLSDSRTPTAHATTHKSGGTDAIKLDELAAGTDVTTLNSSSTKHGLLPKLSGAKADLLCGDGTWGFGNLTNVGSLNPAGTASATEVMMGLAQSMTPNRTGRMVIIMAFTVKNNTIGDGARCQIRFGTGAAPSNGGLPTGTPSGGQKTHIASTAAGQQGMVLITIEVSLVVGTVYWLDIGMLRVTGGTATITDCSVVAVEV